jgi:hypothetical protein
MSKLNLIEAVEKGLNELTEEDSWQENVLHISDLGSTIEGEGCLRQVYLRLQGAEKAKRHAGIQFMFNQGHAIHERIVSIMNLPKEWKLIGTEIECRFPIFKMVGACDMLLQNEETGERVVVDFKTVRGNAFNYLDSPKPGNVAQVQGYIEAFDASYGKLLYIDREGQNGFREFDVQRDRQTVIERANTLYKMALSEEAPDILSPDIKLRENKSSYAIYIKQPWCCDYCDYADISCKTALPYELRDNGVVGHVDKDTGEITLKDESIEDALYAHGTLGIVKASIAEQYEIERE